ncbi:hypothetical protein [Lishizhenia tianjinensis]|nr:hypothetical protein [Lishizhenia tianjinensis]
MIFFPLTACTFYGDTVTLLLLLALGAGQLLQAVFWTNKHKTIN